MKNAIILAGKRTGSTFLQESLNSHSNIVCYDEMFLQNNKKQKRRGQFLFNYMKRTHKYTIQQYIEWLFSFEGSVCFRLMYPHIQKKKDIENIIIKDKIPIIHLIRKNKLNHYISSETKNQKQVRIDPGKMKKKMKEIQTRNIYYRKLFKDKTDYIEIFYEDMFGKVEGDKGETTKYGAFNIKSNQITYLSDKYSKWICDFLDVDHSLLCCNVTKKNSWNIWDHVKNKDEVVNSLKNTEWEKYLND